MLTRPALLTHMKQQDTGEGLQYFLRLQRGSQRAEENKNESDGSLGLFAHWCSGCVALHS